MPHTDKIAVPRSLVRQAAEDAVAASDMATAAVGRALQYFYQGNRSALLNELGRIGFELQEHRSAAAVLAGFADVQPPNTPLAATAAA
jgi:hypothetical protein